MKSDQDTAKLRELIKDVKFAMLTTIDEDGYLHSRPMVAQQFEFDGDLWFFTSLSSDKVDQINRSHQVNVALAEPDDQKYVSISGRAEIVQDIEKARALWSPLHAAYFPKGPNDPDLGLVKVKVHQAEYWDAPSSRLVHLIDFAKAAVTGKKPKIGEHEILQ